jgi:hypothetical protein
VDISEDDCAPVRHVVSLDADSARLAVVTLFVVSVSGIMHKE